MPKQTPNVVLRLITVNTIFFRDIIDYFNYNSQSMCGGFLLGAYLLHYGITVA